jgi:hypothetical protein
VAPQIRAAFYHRDADPGRFEQQRRRQAGDPASEHGDVHVERRIRRREAKRFSA